MENQERNSADRLNRLWDASFGLDEPVPIDGLADLSDAITALHAMDDAPEPDTAFLARLRQDVLSAGDPVPVRTKAGVQSLGLVWPAPVMLPRRSVIRLAVAAIAATLLVAALSGGGHWLSGSGPAPLVASAMASTEPAGATATATATGIPLSQDRRFDGHRIGQVNGSGLAATEVAVVRDVATTRIAIGRVYFLPR